MVVKKNMCISIDIDIARKMLDVAGYYDVYEKSDEEVFELVMKQIKCYCATYKEIPKED